jgi:hypothetical protein
MTNAWNIIWNRVYGSDVDHPGPIFGRQIFIKPGLLSCPPYTLTKSVALNRCVLSLRLCQLHDIILKSELPPITWRKRDRGIFRFGTTGAGVCCRVVARRIAMKLNMHLRRMMVNAFSRGWHHISDFIVQDVPEAMAFCEFDCRKEQCSAQEWASCQWRLKRGAGEFMPAHR